MTVEEPASEIWSTMLKNASKPSAGSGNTSLHDRGTLVVLGKTRDSQTAFVQQICPTTRQQHNDDDLANAFGLGYKHIEYIDSADDMIRDVLAKLDVYTLDQPQESTLNVVPYSTNMAVVITLDWKDCKNWANQLQDWIKLIQRVFMDENRSAQLRRRLQMYDRNSSISAARNNEEGKEEEEEEEEPGVRGISVELPLEAGQYDDPLGVDLIIALCGNEQVEDDSSADFAAQFVRTVAYKHGASVISIADYDEAQRQSVLNLVSERLQIQVHTSGQHEQATPQASEINYTKLVIPAGWDSRGKIEVVKDGFEMDKVLQMWNTLDGDSCQYYKQHINTNNDNQEEEPSKSKQSKVAKTNYQDFLAKQFDILEARQSEDPVNTATPARTTSAAAQTQPSPSDFNVGGIQVENVEEVLRRLKARETVAAAQSSQQQQASSSPYTPTKSSQSREQSMSPGSPSNTQQNDMLQNFFQNLLDRRRNSPGK